jgi:uncharacterized membrane protein YdjX (TVP38/TMEM64 family)
MADDFIHKYGMGAIIIARFLPFVAFDPISYASGLVDMDAKKYALGTFIGSIPRAFFYAFLGATLGINLPVSDVDAMDPDQFRQDAQLFNTILLIILVVLAVMFIAYYIVSKRYEQKLKKKGSSSSSSREADLESSGKETPSSDQDVKESEGSPPA